jgi:hypothetical protein
MLADALRSQTRGFSAPSRTARRSAGTWALIGVPLFLLALFAWQVGASLWHTDVVVRGAVAVARASLETDPAGLRVDLVVVDRVGLDTTVDGMVNVKLRDPDGGVWQNARAVTAADFVQLPAGGLLAGRLGYSVVIPSADWLRSPRRGGSAMVTVSVQPTAGTPFSSVDEERFP